MQKAALYVRKTRRYVDSYRYLDNEEFYCNVKMTPAVMVREPEDYTDGGSFVKFVRVPAGHDPKMTVRAIRDSLSHHGCGHGYDCCGCQSISVDDVVRVRRNRYMVRLNYSYNY